MVSRFSELQDRASEKKMEVVLARSSNTGGPYLEIEVRKGKKLIDSEKIGRSESCEWAAKRMLSRMRKESIL